MTEATARVTDAGWLREQPLAELLAALDADGEEARVSGGAVRDAILGIPRGDIDIATTASPETVVARAKANGWKPVPTGIEHGTVTIVIAGRPFEVTTLRRDVETDGRRAIVSFTRDWAEDALRRDLTINGLMLDREGTVYDHVGGLDDLKAGRVRFIGDARERIREDYLRTLRFFRFHARFARGSLDEEGFAATIAERDGLPQLSGERVRAELLKLLVAPRAAETVAAMAQAGLLAPLTGGAPRLSRFARFAARDAEQPDALLRLAALLQFTSEDAARLKARLRLSNAEAKRLEAIGDLTPALSPADGEQAAKRALYWFGESAYCDRTRLAAIDAPDEDWAGLITLPDRWTPPKFPLTAADFKARGLEGPPLGRALKAAEAAWVEAGFPLSEGELAGLVESVSSMPQAPSSGR
jgi:tRNA nucleotidyltransferase/poly(A) polymerase